jgi:hypothetical protein
MTAKSNPSRDEVLRVDKRGSADLFISSRRPFRDTRLSWGARGLMAFMLSNPNWQGTDSDILSSGPGGAHKLKAMMRELKEAGYVHRSRKNDADGQFVWVTEVYENPEDNPYYNNLDVLLRAVESKEGTIPYCPTWNFFTGSPRATIFLKHAINLWFRNGRKPFYKFSRPCDDSLYRRGESWEEELGMSRGEFETARGKIGLRTQGRLDPVALLSYWVDANRLTWYALNEQATIQMSGTEGGRPGFVYLLYAETGLYKIGLSIDPVARFKSINKQVSEDVQLLHTIPADDRYFAERDLHALYTAKRQEGEWFSLSAEDVDHILSLEKFEGGTFHRSPSEAQL